MHKTDVAFHSCRLSAQMILLNVGNLISKARSLPDGHFALASTFSKTDFQCWVKLSAANILNFILFYFFFLIFIFPRKQVLIFQEGNLHEFSKLETICMKCQNPFSGKTIINMLSAVLVRRKVKGIIQRPYIPSRTKWMVIGKLVLNATAGLTKKKKKKNGQISGPWNTGQGHKRSIVRMKFTPSLMIVRGSCKKFCH